MDSRKKITDEPVSQPERNDRSAGRQGMEKNPLERPRHPKWWSDVLSGRVRKDWAAMAEMEPFEDWARRSLLQPAVPGGEGLRK